MEKEKELKKRKAEMEAKEALKAISPRDFFKMKMSDKYSKFDDQVAMIHLFYLILSNEVDLFNYYF